MKIPGLLLSVLLIAACDQPVSEVTMTPAQNGISKSLDRTEENDMVRLRCEYTDETDRRFLYNTILIDMNNETIERNLYRIQGAGGSPEKHTYPVVKIRDNEIVGSGIGYGGQSETIRIDRMTGYARIDFFVEERKTWMGQSLICRPIVNSF